MSTKKNIEVSTVVDALLSEADDVPVGDFVKDYLKKTSNFFGWFGVEPFDPAEKPRTVFKDVSLPNEYVLCFNLTAFVDGQLGIMVSLKRLKHYEHGKKDYLQVGMFSFEAPHNDHHAQNAVMACLRTICSEMTDVAGRCYDCNDRVLEEIFSELGHRMWAKMLRHRNRINTATDAARTIPTAEAAYNGLVTALLDARERREIVPNPPPGPV